MCSRCLLVQQIEACGFGILGNCIQQLAEVGICLIPIDVAFNAVLAGCEQCSVSLVDFAGDDGSPVDYRGCIDDDLAGGGVVLFKGSTGNLSLQ